MFITKFPNRGLTTGPGNAFSSSASRAHRCTRFRPVQGGNVRRLITLALGSTAVVAIACGKSKTPTSADMSADLKRDLQLASQVQNIQISPDELSPQSKKELAVRPKAAPQGPKVVRTKNPTVKASPKPVQVAEIPTEVPQVQVMAAAPAPSETPSPDAPPMARPAPVPAQNYPSTGQIPANAGAGSVIGAIFGAVIRGGGVGDDDHCDPRGGARRGHPIGGGQVYGIPPRYPLPGGRFPITPINRPR